MLHSKYFDEISKRNQGVKDIRFKFASVAVFVRRVLDKMGLYSKADVERDITCAIKEEFDEFDIVVDKTNCQVVLEADLFGIGTVGFEKKKAQVLERINKYNLALQFGSCMLVGCRVVYRTYVSIYMGIDDAEDVAVAERLINHFEIDSASVYDWEYNTNDETIKR